MPIIWKNATATERRLLRGIQTLAAENEPLPTLILDPKSARLRERPGIIRDDCWHLSHGEMLVVQAALDIWSGNGHLPLWECLETWDRKNWIQFLAAMCIVNEVDIHAVGELLEKCSDPLASPKAGSL